MRRTGAKADPHQAVAGLASNRPNRGAPGEFILQRAAPASRGLDVRAGDRCSFKVAVLRPRSGETSGCAPGHLCVRHAGALRLWGGLACSSESRTAALRTSSQCSVRPRRGRGLDVRAGTGVLSKSRCFGPGLERLRAALRDISACGTLGRLGCGVVLGAAFTRPDRRLGSRSRKAQAEAPNQDWSSARPSGRTNLSNRQEPRCTSPPARRRSVAPG
jgi:hypothetical protein